MPTFSELLGPRLSNVHMKLAEECKVLINASEPMTRRLWVRAVSVAPNPGGGVGPGCSREQRWG